MRLSAAGASCSAYGFMFPIVLSIRIDTAPFGTLPKPQYVFLRIPAESCCAQSGYRAVARSQFGEDPFEVFFNGARTHL